MPRPYAKPTPKVKARRTAEGKPVETKKEPDSARKPAAEVKAPETPPQTNQPGSSSAGPSDDVTYQQTEAAYDFAALLDRLNSDDTLQKVVYLFLTRVYSVFRPEKLPQVGELLAKYDLKLKTLVGAVAAKYLKVRQNRRSRPKGVEEKGKGKGESDRDRTRTPAREPATSSGSTKGAKGKGKGAGKGKNPASDPCDPDHPEARRDLADLNEDALHPEWLSTHYLNTAIVEGHKHGGEQAFKSWIQTRTGGPVRVSYRAHCRNSWDKCEEALKNRLKITWVLWGPSHANWELVETKVPQSEWKYFEGYQPHRMLMFLTPPERARARSAFFVGGWFPDLQASRKSVMTSGRAQQFEDSSKNLDRHDEMLYRALGLKGNFLKKFLKVFVLASSFFQPGACELTSAKVTVRHPGYKMSLLEDTGWTRQISKEIAKEQPDLVLLTYEGLGDCTELSPSAQEFLGRLATGPAKEVCVLDSVSSCRWKYLEPVGSVEEGEREVQVYQGRGDLAIGSTSQALGEVLVDWSNNDHSKYYTPVSIDTVGDQEGFAECVVLALQESCVEEQVASAVEARQEEVVEAGTLDEVADLRDDKVSFMDEEEIAAEADFLDTLPLAGFPQGLGKDTTASQAGYQETPQHDES